MTHFLFLKPPPPRGPPRPRPPRPPRPAERRSRSSRRSLRRSLLLSAPLRFRISSPSLAGAVLVSTAGVRQSRVLVACARSSLLGASAGAAASAIVGEESGSRGTSRAVQRCFVRRQGVGGSVQAGLARAQRAPAGIFSSFVLSKRARPIAGRRRGRCVSGRGREKLILDVDTTTASTRPTAQHPPPP